MDVQSENLSASPATRTHRYVSILRYRNFLKLWGAQASSKLAENVLNFSLVILIYQLTHSSFMVSLLLVLIGVPPILLSAAAGVVADTHNRKTIMFLSNLTRFFLVVMAIIFHEQAWVLLGVAFILSVLAQFFSPAEVSSIPTLVDKEHLFTANSIYSFTSYTTFLIGYTIAGPLLQRWHSTNLFICVMVLYGIASLLSGWLPPLVEHLRDAAQRSLRLIDWADFRHRLTEGMRIILTNRVIRFVMIQMAIVFSIQRGFLSMAPAFAENFLKFNLDKISVYLILPVGVGALAGVLLANTIKHRVAKSQMITGGMIINGLALLSLAFWTAGHSALTALGVSISQEAFAPIIVSILAFLSGFADPFIIVSVQTTLQERTEPADRGRVFGGLYTFMNLAGLAPILIIGAITNLVNLNVVVLILGLTVMTAAVWGIFFYRRYGLGAE
ncbi:MAG: MFS transporter [Patescibacteria group bacterium]|jgi:MFS family permease